MIPEQIVKWAINKRWEKDEQGHLRKSWNGRVYRLKFGKKKLRHEYQSRYYDGFKNKMKWVRVCSAPYKDLSISENDVLTGMRRGI